MESKKVEWLPLEANPQVINNFMKELGFQISEFSVFDVISTEDWAQAMVPQPVLAVFFLYPVNHTQKLYNIKQIEEIKNNGQAVSENLYFMRQQDPNACGTIAILHAIGNVIQNYQDLIKKGDFLDLFFENTKPLNPEERGQALKKKQDPAQEEQKTVLDVHQKASQEGQSKVSEKASGHFICFVEVDGSLYELDGDKELAVSHGRCRSSELLPKACEVIQKIMERDPEEVKFTIMALAYANDPDI